jgi:hypothetical protein
MWQSITRAFKYIILHFANYNAKKKIELIVVVANDTKATPSPCSSPSDIWPYSGCYAHCCEIISIEQSSGHDEIIGL